jgi:uncharacterized membrane protein
MKKKPFQEILVLILIALPIFYLVRTYPSLPSVIPIHFGMDGKPNGFSEKHYIIWFAVFNSLLSAGCYLLIRNLPRIDPKKTSSLGSGNMQKIAIAVVALISAILISMIHASMQGSISFSRLFNPLMGFFFIVVGNLMYNIKPNYFVGIRVPWTLENEDNWRATHHMGGKLWVIGGIIIVICTTFLPGKTGETFFLISVLILALVPIIYSFAYFNKNKTSS